MFKLTVYYKDGAVEYLTLDNEHLVASFILANRGHVSTFFYESIEEAD